MPEWERYGDHILSILDQWDKAEADIKLAEQANYRLSWASIMELRYAGRRLIEALAAIHGDEPDDKIASLFKDAEFDCLRARHDAIDATTTAIADHLNIAASKLGYKAILAAFPTFLN